MQIFARMGAKMKKLMKTRISDHKIVTETIV